LSCRLAILRGWERVHHGDVQTFAELARHGYEVRMVCSTKSRITEQQARMPLQRLPTPAFWGRFTRTIAGGYLMGLVSPIRYYDEYLYGFSRAVRDVDVLCGIDLMHPTCYQALREKRRGKRLVIQFWDNVPFNWPHDRPLREHYDAVLDGADHFLVFSDDADRTLRQQGVAAERRSRVNLGIDTAVWRPGASEKPRREALQVLCVGQVVWRKGIHTVLEAMDLAEVPVDLTVVGTGTEEARLRWMVEQRQRRGRPRLASHVRFLGPRFGEELLRLRQEADVQVAMSIPTPQWREQLNQSMLEGMACGLPPIASESGALPEIVRDGVEGLLVPPDFPPALADAFTRLAREPETRRRLGLASRQRIERDFELTRQGQALAEILRAKVQAP